jgi:hypothetical protein
MVAYWIWRGSAAYKTPYPVYKAAEWCALYEYANQSMVMMP